MKKFVILIVFFCFVFSVFALPTIPKGWSADHPPKDGGGYRYAVGLSVFCETEKEALENAWQAVFSYFASSISTLYEGNVKGQSYEEGLESGIFDTYSVTVSKESWRSTVQLYGVTKLDSKIESENGRCRAIILACISDSDYARSKQAVEDEETCALAFAFFETKEKLLPQGKTYLQWCRQNYIAIQISVSNQGERWNSLMQRYLKKLYRNASLYPCNLEGLSTVLLPARYAKSVKNSLSALECFTVQTKGSSVIVSPHGNDLLNVFAHSVDIVKDSHRIAVFGKEEYALPSGELYVNTDSRAVRNFKKLAEQHFSLSVVSVSESFDFYEDMKSWADNNKKNLSARYFVFCSCETTFSDRDRIMHLKPMVDATLSFLLYDIETGEEYSSDEAVSMPGCAVLTAITDTQVIAKSRVAVDNICDLDKNPEGLLSIMTRVFEKLP
ncbi:MAG: hypothetical protein IKP49_01345 [Treponema sp.]|nr:hypothetical protein [Treponema sp.]